MTASHSRRGRLSSGRHTMISTRRFFTVAIVFLVFLCPSALVRADDKAAKAPVPEIKVRFDARFISVSPAQLKKIDVPIQKEGVLVSDEEENGLIGGIHPLKHASTMPLPAVRAALGHQESTMCLQQQAYVSGWT